MKPAAAEQSKSINQAKANTAALQAVQIDFQHLTLDSMLMDIPSYNQIAAAGMLGNDVAKLFKKDILLPGVIITENDQFIGVISREMFHEKTGKIFGTEVFLVRPINSVFSMISHEPLTCPKPPLSPWQPGPH